MDFFTFIAIAVFLYTFFSKKDKKPQRGQRPPEGYNPVPKTDARGAEELSQPQRKRKESIFEQIERQLRESAEKLEQELQGKTAAPPRRTVTAERPKDTRAAMERYGSEGEQGVEGVEGGEGAWGYEGRSNYDEYRSTQGNDSRSSQGYDSRGSEGYDGRGTEGYDGGYSGEGRPVKQRTQKPASQSASGAVGPTQQNAVKPVLAPQEQMAGIFGGIASPVVQGMIWSEVLKEPKGRRGLSRR